MSSAGTAPDVLKHRGLTWAFFVFLAFVFINFPALPAIPVLARDSWAKLVQYRFDYFVLSDFLATWGGHLWHVALAGSSLLTFMAFGLLFLSWSRSRSVPADRFLFALGLGAGLVSLAVLGAGLCGLLFKGLVLSVSVAGCALALRRRRLTATLRDLSAPLFLRGREGHFLFLALALMGGVCLLVSLGPECGWDPAYYHLRLPKLYDMMHRIYFVPYIYPSHYPQAIEMLYTFLWLPGGEGAAKLINFLFWPLSGLALMRLAYPFGAATAARAAALALTMPLVGTLASENYIDLGLTLFQLLALRAVWIGDPVAAGLLLGFAMGSKYTGIFAALALIGAAAATGRRPRFIATLAAVSAIPVVPWLAKNTAFTGDPVAPLFYGALGSLSWAGGINQAAMGEVLPKMTPGTWGERTASLLLGLWGFLKRGAFGVFSPFLFGMFPALILSWRGCARYLKVFVLVFTLLILLVAPDGRYWQPAAFPLCLLAAAAWGRLARPDRPLLSRSVRVFAAASIVLGVVYHSLEMHAMFTSFFRAVGIEPAFEYDARVLQPNPWYARAVNRLNRSVPAGERIAVISDVQAYKLNREAIFDCDQPGTRRWIWWLPKLRPDEDGLARQFRQWNVRSVFHIRTKAMAGGREEKWGRKEVSLWAGFWNSRARLVADMGACAIYELRREKGERRIQLDLPGPQDWLLVNLREELGTLAERRELYMLGQALGVESAATHVIYGMLANDGGAAREGVAAIKRAIRLSPSVPGLWFSLVRVLTGLDDLEGARRALAEGRRLDPDSEALPDLEKLIAGAAAGKS